MNLGPVAKALVGCALALIAALISAIQPDSQAGASITLGEGLTMLGALVVASALVWRADNVRWFPYAKAAAALLTVLLSYITPSVIAGTFDLSTFLQALVGAAASFGIVSQVPNATVTEWHDPIGGDGEPEPEDDPELDDDLTDDGPVDANGDGHDDHTGQWMPKGSNVVERDGGVSFRARLYLPPSRVLGYLSW